MAIEAILDELKAEHDRLNTAINALEGRTVNIGSVNGLRVQRLGAVRVKATPFALSVKPDNRGSRLTPEGRRRLSLAMKRRWRAKKKAQGN